MNSSTLVKVEKVSKCFGKARVLNNVSFEIPKGSVLGILGPYGSGKSTLMRIIAGLIKTWGGSIYFDGKPIEVNEQKDVYEFGTMLFDKLENSHSEVRSLLKENFG